MALQAAGTAWAKIQGQERKGCVQGILHGVGWLHSERKARGRMWPV